MVFIWIRNSTGGELFQFQFQFSKDCIGLSPALWNIHILVPLGKGQNMDTLSKQKLES
jgi:hypothetical protein